MINGTREPTLVSVTPGQALAIGWLYYDGIVGQALCTGTVIAPRTVLTARHCTRGRTPENVGFGVGLQPQQPLGTFEVESIHEHPGVDAAVLVLTTDPMTEIANLQPIPVNRTSVGGDRLGQPMEGAGFGDTRAADRTGRYFVTVVLTAIQADYLFTDGEGVQGLCHGDSGGPLLAQGEQGPMIMAVLHRGNSSCVDKDKLTRVDAIVDWIDASAAGAPPGACDGLDYFGACEGRTAVWCEDGEVNQRDCTQDDGAVCGYVNPELGFYCRPPSPCDDIPWGGMCRGEVLVLCDGTQVQEQDCSAMGLLCTEITAAASCRAGDELSRLASLNARRVTQRGGCQAHTGKAPIGWICLLLVVGLRRRTR
ncbi:MAG: S1 family peptidase [Bradymonadia bacterium]